jgi:hypothetical protein
VGFSESVRQFEAGRVVGDRIRGGKCGQQRRGRGRDRVEVSTQAGRMVEFQGSDQVLDATGSDNESSRQ